MAVLRYSFNILKKKSFLQCLDGKYYYVQNLFINNLHVSTHTVSSEFVKPACLLDTYFIYFTVYYRMYYIHILQPNFENIFL